MKQPPDIATKARSETTGPFDSPAEIAARTRAAQGLPPHVTDSIALGRIARALIDHPRHKAAA